MAEASGFLKNIADNGGEVGFEAFKENFEESEHGVQLSKIFNLLAPEGFITSDSFGTISTRFDGETDLKALVEKIRSNTPACEAMKIVTEADDDGNKQISVYEFPALMKQFSCTSSLEDIYIVFEFLDEDESFLVSHDEVESFLWDSWIANPGFATIEKLVNGAVASILEEKKGKETTNMDVTQAEQCLKYLELENADAEKFKAKLDELGSKHETDDKNHDVDDFVWSFIEPFNAENIVRCCMLFGVNGDHEDGDGEWEEDFLDDLVDDIREIYTSTAKLLRAFSEGGEDLSKEHFMKLMEWLGLEPSEDLFVTLDDDKSNSICIKELGPKMLASARVLDNKASIPILKNILTTAIVG